MKARRVSYASYLTPPMASPVPRLNDQTMAQNIPANNPAWIVLLPENAAIQTPPAATKRRTETSMSGDRHV